MFNLYWTLGIAVISLLIGLVTGYEFESSRYQLYKESVIVAQKVAESETKSKEIEAQNTTKEINDAYQNDIAVIRKFYTSRVQHSAGGKLVPQVSFPTGRANESSSDTGLAEKCTETTEQLTLLQKWIKDEQSIYNR